MSNPHIDSYERAADALIPRYEAISSARMFAQVADLLPPPPARVADIGAGTGRDAAWFAASGYQVTAVEPTPAFRRHGEQTHAQDGVAWIDDQLPDLPRLSASGAAFDLVSVMAVWQHIDPPDRQGAMTTLAGLMDKGGRLIMSLRHGPSSHDRPMHPIDVEETCRQAETAGLAIIHCKAATSVQVANVDATWTWLAADRPPVG